MNEDMKQAKCGNCGGEQFTVWMEDTTFPTTFITKCEQCGSESKVEILPSRMTISFGKNSDGILAVF